MQLPPIGDVPFSVNTIGYVTDDIDKSIATCLALGGTGFTRIESGPVTLANGQLPGSAGRMALRMPTGGGNFLGDYMERHGPGLCYLGVSAPEDEFDQWVDALVAAGCVLVMDLRVDTLSTAGGYTDESVAGMDQWIEEQEAAGNLPADMPRMKQIKACIIDCTPIGFPLIEMAGVDPSWKDEWTQALLKLRSQI